MKFLIFQLKNKNWPKNQIKKNLKINLIKKTNIVEVNKTKNKCNRKLNKLKSDTMKDYKN